MTGKPEPVAGCESIEDLIERSSLGTPAAKAMRARTPEHVARRIVDEVNRRIAAESGLACGDEQPFTGFLCRVVGPHDLHDYDGVDPWTPPTNTKD